LGPAPKWDKRKGIYWFYLNYSAKITTSEARLLSAFLGFRRGGSNYRSIIELFLFIELHCVQHSVQHKWIGRLFDYLLNISISISLLSNRMAQRLAAQPLGRVRYVAIILAGNPKPQFSVLSLSLGQVGCSRGLGPTPKWDKRM
jgi:hypothetical protein